MASQAPLSMELSRQESWSELPFPFPGDLPGPGIKPRQADSLPSEPPGKPEQIEKHIILHLIGRLNCKEIGYPEINL